MPTNTAKNLRNAIVQDQSKPIIPVNPRVIVSTTFISRHKHNMAVNTSKLQIETYIPMSVPATSHNGLRRDYASNYRNLLPCSLITGRCAPR